MGERSLVLFTLMAQTACGTLVGLAGVQLLGSADVLGPLPFIAIGLLILGAAIISTLHLGAPRHALYAVSNWRSSWLSREILALGLTGGLVAIGALVALLGDGGNSQSARTLIAILAAVAGIALVVTMVQLYSMRTVPEWRPSLTASAFAGTTLRLGSIATALLAATELLPDGSLDAAAAVWLVLLLGAGMGLWLLTARTTTGPARTDRHAGALLVRGRAASGADRQNRSLRWLAIGSVGALAGMVVLVTGPALLAAAVLVCALTVMAVGELHARERFYRAAPSRGRDLMRPPSAARASARSD